MFAPKVAKPQTKAAESPTSKLARRRSTLAARPFGADAVEEAHMLQRSIDDRATPGLLSQRTLSLTGNEPGGDHEREADRESMTARETPRGVSWDFSKIAIFAPDRANRSQTPSSLSAPPLPAVMQPKLVVGQANDPLEHEANRVAEQVMRMPAKGDGPDQPAQPETVPRPVSPAARPTETPAPDQETTVSGSIPDIRTPPGEGRSTGEEIAAADTPGTRGVSVTTNISLKFSQPRTHWNYGGKHDAVVSGVAMGAFSQPGGRAVSQFGAEFFEPAFTGVHYAFKGGKCTISANLDIVCPWGTNSGGDTDVPSGTAPVITAADWPAIKADLEPSATSPYKSPRTKYYSQSLVERHERFHGTDDHGWAIRTGLGIVKTNLEAGTAAPKTAAVDVKSLVGSARTKLVAENFKWYKGAGASHDSYAGEIRAYTDGRPLYKALADAVEARGKSLAPAPRGGQPAVVARQVGSGDHHTVDGSAASISWIDPASPAGSGLAGTGLFALSDPQPPGTITEAFATGSSGFRFSNYLRAYITVNGKKVTGGGFQPWSGLYRAPSEFGIESQPYPTKQTSQPFTEDGVGGMEFTQLTGARTVSPAVAGGAVGRTVGHVAGGGVGAAIGSFFGPLGTAIGYFAGEYLGDKAGYAAGTGVANAAFNFPPIWTEVNLRLRGDGQRHCKLKRHSLFPSDSFYCNLNQLSEYDALASEQSAWQASGWDAGNPWGISRPTLGVGK
ncbi:MAG: hypothetical protein ACHQRJ_10270 [Alphaproteobacteria bacterium]